MADERMTPTAALQKPVVQRTTDYLKQWLEWMYLGDYAVATFRRTNGALLVGLSKQDIEERFPGDMEAQQNCLADLRQHLGKG